MRARPTGNARPATCAICHRADLTEHEHFTGRNAQRF